MLNYVDRVNEIKALLEGMADAGIVHNRSRLAIQHETFIARFKDPNGKVNGWEITRAKGDPTVAPDWREIYLLRKYRGFQDAESSEIDFQSELDEAVRLFRDTLNLTYGSVEYGLSIELAEERMFGSVLCHYAECQLQVLIDIDQL